MDCKSAGRFTSVLCILITFTTGVMKALFPDLYNLIGSACLVLVALSMLAVCIIYCVIPNVHCFNSHPNESNEVDSSHNTSKECHNHNSNTTTVLMEEKPQMMVINGATCLHI